MSTGAVIALDVIAGALCFALARKWREYQRVLKDDSPRERVRVRPGVPPSTRGRGVRDQGVNGAGQARPRGGSQRRSAGGRRL